MADPNITVTEQIVREAPDIEAYKLGLLEAGKTLANIPIRLPEQQVIGADPLEASVYDYLGGMGTAGIGGTLLLPLLVMARLARDWERWERHKTYLEQASLVLTKRRQHWLLLMVLWQGFRGV